jgi:glycosyltransferase involved in cell wall biosynthesis
MTVSTDGPHPVAPCYQPLVSVLVPSYQAGPYLALLVESVRAQTYQRWELLILDDGSGDLDRPDVQDVLADDRIRAFRWSPNRGVSQATRFLMEEARGEFWCYPGADDLLLPQFIEKRLTVLDRHPEVSLVFGRGGQIDTAGKEIWFDLGRKTYDQMKPLEEQVIEAQEMLDLLLAANIINTPSILARSRATLPILTRYQLDWRYCQDWFYWLLLAAHGQLFYYSGEILHSYRQLGLAECGTGAGSADGSGLGSSDRGTWLALLSASSDRIIWQLACAQCQVPTPSFLGQMGILITLG